jgi:hypothetical protein
LLGQIVANTSIEKRMKSYNSSVSVDILAVQGSMSKKQIPHPAETAGFGMTASQARPLIAGCQQSQTTSSYQFLSTGPAWKTGEMWLCSVLDGATEKKNGEGRSGLPRFVQRDSKSRWRLG